MGVRDEVSRWEISRCSECARVFPREKSWQALCPVCFKEGQGYTILVADRHFAALQGAYTALESKVQRLEADLAAERRKQAAPPPPPPPAEFTATQLQKLIALCHPDKHKNSADSTEVTKWLLQLRQRQRSDTQR